MEFQALLCGAEVQERRGWYRHRGGFDAGPAGGHSAVRFTFGVRL